MIFVTLGRQKKPCISKNAVPLVHSKLLDEKNGFQGIHAVYRRHGAAFSVSLWLNWGYIFSKDNQFNRTCSVQLKLTFSPIV